jgi:hypothetical protein
MSRAGVCPNKSRVSDVHFGLATLHDLIGMTVRTKYRNEYYIALLLHKTSAWHKE